MNNQECRVRPQIVNINTDDPVFFLFSIKTSKRRGSCDNTNDPYAEVCVPGVVKNLNVRVFDLMSRTNERRHIEWHGTSKCKCRLDANICNNKKKQNNDKCRCEYNKRVCNKGFIWNPSTCEWECDELCDVGEYFDYENCKYRKKLVDILVEVFAENFEEVYLAEITFI